MKKKTKIGLVLSIILCFWIVVNLIDSSDIRGIFAFIFSWGALIYYVTTNVKCKEYFRLKTKDEKRMWKEKDAENKKAYQGFVTAVIIMSLLTIVGVGAQIYFSSLPRSQCIYCDKYFSGSGNTCSSCRDWLNDAQDAIEDYRGY